MGGVAPNQRHFVPCFPASDVTSRPMRTSKTSTVATRASQKTRFGAWDGAGAPGVDASTPSVTSSATMPTSLGAKSARS